MNYDGDNCKRSRSCVGCSGSGGFRIARTGALDPKLSLPYLNCRHLERRQKTFEGAVLVALEAFSIKADSLIRSAVLGLVNDVGPCGPAAPRIPGALSTPSPGGMVLP